ncbi:MAG: peptidylprolyl isomerase [Variibacter sp.]|nr:peptidylprolyl isomerase [Variibacter sp.]
MTVTACPAGQSAWATRSALAGLCGLLAAALLTGIAGPARAQSADPVIARVNGTEIRSSDLAIAEEELGPQLPPMTSEAKRDYLVAYLSDTILVAQAADQKNLGETPDFKRRLAFVRNKLLSETLLQQEAKASVTESEMRKVYEEAAKQIGSEKEVRARHILVDTEDEAKGVLAELKRGADFAELAKKKSKDPGAAEGGDLGYFTKDQMVPEFAEAAFTLPPGKVSDPVKTQFGWHIIRVEDRRDRTVPEFEKVKDQIENFLVRKRQAELVAKLRADAKIERLEPKPPAATEPKK